MDDLRYRLWMRGLRAIARTVLGAAYRLRVEGAHHVPAEGGVLAVSNHVSFHDWLLVGAALPRPPRFVMHQHHHQYPLLRAFFDASRVIPIAPRKEDPARLERAMDEIDRALAAGELVVLFPEGTMSPDGRLGPLRPGIERILARRPVPLVPIGVEGLWGSTFSRARGEPMARWSRRVRARVTVRIGAPIAARDVVLEDVRARIASLARCARAEIERRADTLAA